jgi:long-chain acyl-CoA synthetase
MGVQVGQILRQAARLSPSAIALVDLGDLGTTRREFSYAQLEAAALRTAQQLLAAGVGPGDRVALVAENQAEVVVAWFGAVYAGAAIVPMNVLSSASELGERLRHCGAKLLIHDAARAELSARALAECGSATRMVELARVASLSAADSVATAALEVGAGSDGPVAFPLDLPADATALVLYTSGTTGRPKGAAISHASLLLHSVLLCQHALGLGPESRVLCTLPLSHSYGCRLAMLAPFYARARIVIVPRFDPVRTLAVARAEGVTWLPAVPTMFAAWAKLMAAEPLPRLGWALCAGAPLGEDVARRAEAVLGAEIRQGYGMTEATFASMNAPPDARVFGSVGKPIWGVELRIVDADGCEVAAPASGEVLVRGHNVMSHYLHDAEATTDALEDGWVHSGDVGHLDDRGRLYIVDRIKDLVIRGGYNVYPSEVENVLGAHPDVHEVAVIGRPDAFYGEEIVAVIVPRDGALIDFAGLQALASERLSRSKQPREYAFVAALPLGASGKVHKRTLRAWLVDGHIRAEKVSG